ncbi:MAG: hypothetical protein WDN01_15820 [Rhizomicrobium sp.]
MISEFWWNLSVLAALGLIVLSAVLFWRLARLSEGQAGRLVKWLRRRLIWSTTRRLRLAVGAGAALIAGVGLAVSTYELGVAPRQVAVVTVDPALQNLLEQRLPKPDVQDKRQNDLLNAINSLPDRTRGETVALPDRSPPQILSTVRGFLLSGLLLLLSYVLDRWVDGSRRKTEEVDERS